MEDGKKEIIKTIIGIAIAILFTVFFWFFMMDDFANAGRFNRNEKDNISNYSENQESVPTENSEQQEDLRVEDKE